MQGEVEGRMAEVESMRRWFVRVCRRNYPHLADDVDSYTAEAVWRAAGRFDAARGNWRTYAKVRIRGSIQDVKRQAMLTGYRKRGQPAEEEAVAVVSLESLGDSVPLPADPEAGGTTPDDDRLWSIMRRLPSEQLDALLLSEVLGMGNRETARALGISHGCVAGRVNAAKRTARKLLAAEGFGLPLG
jgi:RNA polymerase sigma factor (sigma-70 family)